VKRPVPYEVVMPISKMAVFHSAPKRERKALLDFFDRLAANPFLESEWSIEDATGRTHFRPPSRKTPRDLLGRTTQSKK
jgi:hypothetical protein